MQEGRIMRNSPRLAPDRGAPSRSSIAIRSGVRGGKLAANHCEVRVRTGVRGGKLSANHTEAMRAS
jgi:hypothetical protein